MTVFVSLCLWYQKNPKTILDEPTVVLYLQPKLALGCPSFVDDPITCIELQLVLSRADSSPDILTLPFSLQFFAISLSPAWPNNPYCPHSPTRLHHFTTLRFSTTLPCTYLVIASQPRQVWWQRRGFAFS